MGDFFGDGIAAVGKVIPLVSVLQMERDRVMEACADSIFQEIFLELIPLSGSDNVKVVDRLGPGRLEGNNYVASCGFRVTG